MKHIDYRAVRLEPYPIPKSRLLEEDMEKFGVDTTTAGGEKTAAPTGKCPLCGSKLEEGTSTPKCPVHGTAPFEKTKEG